MFFQILICFIPLAACFWPFPASDQMRSREPQALISNPLEGTPRNIFTTTSISSNSMILGTSSGKTNDFLFASNNQGFVVVDPVNGNQLAQRPGAIQFVNEKGYLVIYNDGKLQATDPVTGKAHWSASMPQSAWPVLSSNFKSARTHYLGANGNTFWSYDDSGLLWSLKIPDYQRTTAKALPFPAVIDSTGRYVFFAVLYDQGFLGSFNFIYAVDTLEQNIIWSNSNFGVSPVKIAQFMTIQIKAPLVSKEYLIVSSTGGIVSLNMTNGAIVWQYSLFTSGAMALPTSFSIERQILIVGFDNSGSFGNNTQGLIALNPSTGKWLWRFEVPGTPGFSPSCSVISSSSSKYVAVFGAGSFIYQIDLSNGKLITSTYFPLYYTGSPIYSVLNTVTPNPMVLWRDARSSPFISRLYTLLSQPTNVTGSYETVLAGFQLLPQQNALCCLYRAADFSEAAVCNSGALNSTCPVISGFPLQNSRTVTSCSQCLCKN